MAAFSGFITGTCSVNNGSKNVTITVLDPTSSDPTEIASGTAIFIDNFPPVEAVSGSGIALEITLAENWPHATVTAQPFTTINTIEALRDAIQRARNSTDTYVAFATSFETLLTSTDPTVTVGTAPNDVTLTPYGYLAEQFNLFYGFTTDGLIASTSVFTADTVLTTTGFTTAGDGGGGQWIQNGVTGQTASQTPAQLAGALLNDANGNQWELIDTSVNTLNKLGIKKDDLGSASNNALIIQAAYNWADSTGLDQTITCDTGIYYYQPVESIYVIAGHTLKGSGQGANPNVTVYEETLSSDGTTFCLVGTGAKLVRTRREYRGSISDPQDAPISVGFDLEGVGAKLEDLRMELFCDYTNTSQFNLGDNWDVQVKVTRASQELRRVSFKGYPRYKHLLLDATRGVGLPEFNNSFPTDTNAKGIDGVSLHGIRAIGGPSIGLLGPKPKPGLLHRGFSYDTACKIVASSNVSDGDTVTIDGVVFTFKTTKNYKREVQIGATSEESLYNLRNEWLVGKQAPYEDLTLNADAVELYIYSRSTTPTPIAESSASLSITEIDSAVVVTATVAISDPAPYYDEILATTVDDGRNSLGASDFVLEDYMLSVAHHSGYRVTDIDPAKNPAIEPDTIWASLHIDGMGGSIFIHKFSIGSGRFESVEPFNVRLGLCGRGFIGPSPSFDSNVTAWLSTTGGALTAADQYGKVSGSIETTCRVAIVAHDDPGDYYPWDINGNRQWTNFREYIREAYIEEDAHVGKVLSVGSNNTNTDSGKINLLAGRNANAELIFGNETNSNIGRVRVSPSGGITLSVSPGGTGPFENVMFASSSSVILYSDVTIDIDGGSLSMKSPDGTTYTISPPNGGGAVNWV
jgi:hypothetical protein